MFRGERVKVGPVTAVAGQQPTAVGGDGHQLAPGEMSVLKNDVYVGTGTTSVLLGEVRAQGKKPMAAGAWARGVRIEAGETLG